MEEVGCVGIITFHRAENYGAFLQAYALQKAIEGISSEKKIYVIDYNPPEMEKVYISHIGGWYDKKCSIITNLIRGTEHYYHIYLNSIRSRRFKSCLRKLNLKELNTKQHYDTIVVGSDQVWNTKTTSGIVPYYFGVHPCLESVNRRISYAASLGGMRYDEKELSEVKKLIACFDAVSVREKTDITYVASITGEKVHSVIDPTLLMDDFFWNTFASKCKEEDYILFYTLEENHVLLSSALDEAKKRGATLIIISPVPLIRKRSIVKTKYIWTVGPDEFVALIKNASAVFTNSFHATCFSLIFRKKFHVALHSKTGNRIQDLLDALGMGTLTSTTSKEINATDWDKLYKVMEVHLAELKKKSLNYLKDNI